MSFDHLDKQICLLNLEMLCIYTGNKKSPSYNQYKDNPHLALYYFFVHMYICFPRWFHIYGNICNLDLDNDHMYILSKPVHKSYNLFGENIDHVLKVFQDHIFRLPVMRRGQGWYFNWIILIHLTASIVFYSIFDGHQIYLLLTALIRDTPGWQLCN